MTEYRHEIPMRWADLDSLNHVNNVVYLAYAADARAEIDDLPAGPLGEVEVQFRRPVLLGAEPVVVTSQVEQDELRQSIGVRGSEDEFARITSRFGAFAPRRRPRPRRARGPAGVASHRSGRFGTRHVRAGLRTVPRSSRPLHQLGADAVGPGNFVIAAVTVRYHRPVEWRSEPLRACTMVSHVGRSSFAIEAQLADGDGILASASAAMVGFEASTQRSRPFDESEQAQLRAAMGPVRPGR